MEWATREKRTFLRQRIESRLAALHLGAKSYSAALALINRLLGEARPLPAPHCHQPANCSAVSLSAS